MTSVLDVSGALEIILQKENAGKYDDILQKSSIVLAPDLYVSELTNTFWKYHRAKISTKDECVQYIQDGINLVNEFINTRELWHEAFSESVNNGHSTYDMFYLVVARRNNGILITSDSVLAEICKKNSIEVCF